VRVLRLGVVFCDDISTRNDEHDIRSLAHRASEFAINGAVHSASARPLQGFLARLTRKYFTDFWRFEKYFDRKHPLSATIRADNVGPNLGQGVGGWGTKIGAGLSKVEDENRSQLNSATTFNNLIVVNKRGWG
jgi:hypothetical protein